MPFLAPLLLFGAVFAAAPIIIHLLNRRRYQLVQWAPMKYLKLTLKTNRRRLQLEQWILLAIRTLLILLLIFAVARFYLAGDSAAAFLSLKGRTSQVILIDDSLSMGLNDNGQSAFEDAIQQAKLQIESLGTEHSLTVATTSGLQNPLRRDAIIEPGDASQLATELDALKPTDAANDWKQTFDELAAMLGGTTHDRKIVHIITDQRAAGWPSDLKAQAQKLSDMGVELVITKVGVDSRANATLASLNKPSGIVLANSTIEMTATIDVQGNPRFVGQHQLIIDGQPSDLDLPAFTANETDIEIPIEVTLQDPGLHTIEVRLAEDALPGDNTASVVVNVMQAVRILVVDGEKYTGKARADSETYFLKHVLRAGDKPIQTTIVNDQAIPDFLGDYEMVILANVKQLDGYVVNELARRVKNGMGLVIFVGDQVDIEHYNEVLYKSNGKEGYYLLPAKLASSDPHTDLQGLFIKNYNDTPLPTLAGAQSRSPLLLSKTRPTEVMSVVVPEPPTQDELKAMKNEDTANKSKEEFPINSRVLAYWRGAENVEAAIEKRIGKGRVILWTVPCDREWSDWPGNSSYLAAMRDMVREVPGSASTPRSLTAGKILKREVSGSNRPTRARVKRPGEDEPVAALIRDIGREDELGTTESESRVVIEYADTTRAGLYEMTWEVPGRSDAERDVFALSPDTRESDLARIEPEQLNDRLPGMEIKYVDRSSSSTGGALHEMWRTLAMLALAFVVIESAFAAWVGREH